MLVKSQVKYIQSLGHKKFRDADAVFVAEGPKIVGELLESKVVALRQCFATAEWINLNQAYVRGHEQQFFITGEREMERISNLHTPNQVIGVFSKPVFNFDLNQQRPELLLDTIQDPGNLGTIIRNADWFGVHRIVCSVDSVDAFNPKVIQSAMGSIIRVELIYTDLKEYIENKHGFLLYATTLDGEDLTEKVKLSNILILMGNESRGISPALISLATKKIRIPRKGGAESLNVAVASGIILSHIEQVS